jgi:hypothetical protein
VRVAVLSDIHDNLGKLRAALEALHGVQALICLGDLCSPFVVKEFGQRFRAPTSIVFGNNDGDRFRITEAARAYPQIQILGEFAELDLGGKRFAINHFDGIGRALARSGQYDVVCFGHNHAFEVAHEGPTLVINPGEIFGGLTGRSTFVVYDTRSSEVERREV